ncbi:zinc metalloproteinase nas-23-like [Macrobrachium nipponense]|uniref:zinc metalloproteinase nas-23-like n=1 Tax=Macrobrachium nipponense TaxID=159736 RepID=UPI0030C89247
MALPLGVLWVGWTGNVTGVILPKIMKTTLKDVDVSGLNISRSGDDWSPAMLPLRASLRDMTALKNQLLFEWSPGLVRDPIEMAGLPEGDILPNPNLQRIKQGGAQDKNAVSDYFRLWPGGVVPYQFSAEFSILPLQRYIIRQVMEDIRSQSCVAFVERHSQPDYINIVFDGTGSLNQFSCYSHIGRVGGEQVLSLGLFCVKWWDRGTIYHELLHSLGFFHEHNRPDRDRHVEIQWSNIKYGQQKNFEKREMTDVEMFDMPYDLGSVMHYSPYAFGKWYIFSPTIKSRSKGYNFKRSTQPTKIDYQKLNHLYRCARQGRVLVSLVGNTGPSASWFSDNGFELDSPAIQQNPEVEILHPSLLTVQAGLNEKMPSIVSNLKASTVIRTSGHNTAKAIFPVNSTSTLRNWVRPRQVPLPNTGSVKPVVLTTRTSPLLASLRPNLRPVPSLIPHKSLQGRLQNITLQTNFGIQRQRPYIKGLSRRPVPKGSYAHQLQFRPRRLS